MIEAILSQIANFSIPVPVTLACACVCAYMLAKIPKDLKEKQEQVADQEPSAPKAERRAGGDRRRTDKLINKLTIEVEDFHRDLEVHNECLQQLRLAIASIDQGEHVEINDEAMQTLRSIEHHCEEMPRAFDAIRQTTKSAVESLTTASDIS